MPLTPADRDTFTARLYGAYVTALDRITRLETIIARCGEDMDQHYHEWHRLLAKVKKAGLWRVYLEALRTLERHADRHLLTHERAWVCRMVLAKETPTLQGLETL